MPPAETAPMSAIHAPSPSTVAAPGTPGKKPTGKKERSLLPKARLDINAFKAAVPTKQRVRQVLYTHQGRDKAFKVIQYILRLMLWFRGVAANPTYRRGAERQFTYLEQNLMTVTNARRMFKLGRFLTEFSRMKETLNRCADLATCIREFDDAESAMKDPVRLNAPSPRPQPCDRSDNASPLAPVPPPLPVPERRGAQKDRKYTRGALVVLQIQMVLDIAARGMMCCKTVFDDIAYAARKGFLHADVEQKLSRISARFLMPVVSIDLMLNSLRIRDCFRDSEFKSIVQRMDLEEEIEELQGVLAEVELMSSVRRQSSVAALSAAAPAGAPPAAVTGAPASGSLSPGSGPHHVAGERGRVDTTSIAPISATLQKFEGVPTFQSPASTGKRSAQAVSFEEHPGDLTPPPHVVAGPPPVLPGSDRKIVTISPHPHNRPHSESPHSEALQRRRSDIQPHTVSLLTEYAALKDNAAGKTEEEEHEEDLEEQVTLKELKERIASKKEALAEWAPVTMGQLLWHNKAMHWAGVTQSKLLCEAFVALSVLFKWRGRNATLATVLAGLVSALLSMYRVWSYGR